MAQGRALIGRFDIYRATMPQQIDREKGTTMVKRFLATVALAVVWSTVSISFLALGPVLLGAAMIGILGTIGVEPPRRRPRSEELEPVFA